MANLFSNKQDKLGRVREIIVNIFYIGNFVVALGVTILTVFLEFKADLHVKAYLQAILVILTFLSLTFTLEKFDVWKDIFKFHNNLKRDVDYIKDSVVGLQGNKRVKDILHELDDILEKWRGTLNRAEGRVLEETWVRLVSMYLKQEVNGLVNKSISSTSEIYTQLNSKLTEYLYEDALKREGTKLCRLHITGMLPEEFFNGPQIEYTTLDRSPIIFCHAYENDEYGESHYKAQEEMPKYKNLDRKRCIVVRDINAPDEFSALSTLDDLKTQFELSIRQGGKKTINQLLRGETDPEEYLARLFIHCEDKVTKYKDATGKTRQSFLEKIVHSEDYTYYPIAKTSNLDNLDGYVDLIAHFKETYSKDIYYFCATEKDGANHQLKRYFRIGGWPEITLFGYLSSSAQKELRHSTAKGAHKEPRNSSAKRWSELVEWKVGIESHYRPLTRHMDIKLLDAGEAKTLVGIFSPWLKEAKQLKELILFQAKDLTDAPGLAQTLKDGKDAVSAYLRQRLAPPTSRLLANYTPPNPLDPELLKALVTDLNSLLQGSSLYEAESFKAIPLSNETRELLTQNPQEEDLIRLNRMLLEDAYRGKITKNLIS